MLWQNAHSLIDPLINSRGFYSWSFNPLFPVDVRFYTLDKCVGLRMNRHDYLELVYLSQGEMTLQVHRRYFNVKAGDLYVIASTFFHRPVKCGAPPTKGVELLFLPQAVLGRDSGMEDVEYLMPFLSQGTDFPHVVTARTGIPSKVLELVKLIHAELPATPIRRRLNARTYLKMILVLLGNHYANYHVNLRQFRYTQVNIARLRPVLEYVDQHFADPIRVGDATAMVQMSQSGFTRFFRNVTGQAFVAYINHLRVARAEELLATTDIPIAALCQEVGFCDQSYLGTIFRKLIGMPPAQYRRQFSGTLVQAVSKKDLLSGSFAREENLDLGECPPTLCLKQPGQIPIKPGDLVQ